VKAGIWEDSGLVYTSISGINQGGYVMEGLLSPVHLLTMLVIFALFVFWLWMLIDCLKNPRLQGTEKIVWILVIILLYGLGALIYFFVGRKK
jgi:heme A synthase